MANPTFEGTITAIITPFVATGIKNDIDYESLRALVELQNKYVNGIVPCGTTGESPTLDHSEHNRVIEFVIENSKVPVIAGTGSNCTYEAIEMSRHAVDAGAAATLQVCPYYNKPNQEGMFRHFGTIAGQVDAPQILYNIPGRAGKAIEAKTMARLAREYSNIIGVKEATGKPESWKQIREECGANFIILSGNDEDTFSMMRDYGGRGVISVASNIIPERIRKFTDYGLAGRFEEMGRENDALANLFKGMFVDTNPIPVKHAAHLMGLTQSLGFRLPICETSRENIEKIREMLRSYRLIG